MGEYLLQVNEYLDVVFTYGAASVYVVIFAACFLENVFPPFPGDSFIVVGGFVAGLGRLDPVVTILIASAGGTASVLIVYWISHRVGRNYFIKKNFRFFTREDLKKAEERLHRHGSWMLLGSCFLMGFHSALTITFGIVRYPFWKVVVYTFISYVLFSSILVFGAQGIVENIELFEHYAVTYSAYLWAIVILAFSFRYLQGYYHRRKERALKKKN